MGSSNFGNQLSSNENDYLQADYSQGEIRKDRFGNNIKHDTGEPKKHKVTFIDNV
jgi:hypothetical protein